MSKCQMAKCDFDSAQREERPMEPTTQFAYRWHPKRPDANLSIYAMRYALRVTLRPSRCVCVAAAVCFHLLSARESGQSLSDCQSSSSGTPEPRESRVFSVWRVPPEFSSSSDSAEPNRARVLISAQRARFITYSTTSISTTRPVSSEQRRPTASMADRRTKSCALQYHAV